MKFLLLCLVLTFPNTLLGDIPLGISPQTSLLIVTRKSVRIQPIAQPELYRRVEFPREPSWQGRNIDFDIDQQMHKIALLTDTEKRGNELHILDFSPDSKVITVAKAMNSTSPSGYFTADKIRFTTDFTSPQSTSSFCLWSSIERKPKDSLFNINRAKCPNTGDNKCAIVEYKVAKEPENSSKLIVDVTSAKDAGYYTLFESFQFGTTNSQFNLADSHMFDMLTTLDTYLSKGSMAVARDPVSDQLWVIGISLRSRLILAKIQNFMIVRTYEVKPSYWSSADKVEIVDKVERLSIYDNVACISYRSRHNTAVAIFKVDSNEKTTSLPAMAIDVNGLVGASCLSPKSLDKLSRFGSELIHVSHDPDSTDHPHDKGYIALIAVGLVMIFFGIVLAVGSACLFHLKRRMLAFQRFDRVLFTKHGYEHTDEVDDDRFLLKNETSEQSSSQSTTKADDETIPINA